MAEVKEIHVAFKKTVSDGSYGNETHEARLTVTPTADGDGVGLDEVLETFAAILEEHVNERLKQSRSDGIRHAMETVEEREARYAKERQEAKVRQEQARAERDAQLAARPGDDDDDDDDTPF